ncbi:hypothetical protein D3C76_445010 [compost metagenome]
MFLQDLVEVGGHHGTGVDHGVAQRLRLGALADVDPHGFKAKRRVARGNAVERTEHLPRVDCQFAVRVDLGFGQDHPHQGQAIGAGLQVEVVADVHGGHEEAQVLRQLLAHALDPRQQLATLVAIDQRDQPVADLQANHVDRRDVVPAQLLGFQRTLWRGQQILLALRLLQRLRLGLLLLLPHQVGATTGQQAEAEEGHVRHARHQAHDDHQRAGHRQGLGRIEHLPVDQLAHVLGARGAGNHDRGSGGQQQ